MRAYAHPPEDPEATPDSAPDEVEVYGSYALSLALFSAWRDHGVMPRAGGYEDQPRQWHKMIDLFNQRYHRAYYKFDSEDVDTSSFRVETNESATPSYSFSDLAKRG